MTQLFRAAILATAMCATAGTAMAQQTTESRPIDAKVSRINLGGVLELHVKQGPTASLTLSGDRRLLSKVTTRQNGDVLTIDMDKIGFSWGKNEGTVRADLTVPNLSEFTSRGVGEATMTGFSGNSITLVQDGAGAINMSGNYRYVKARLAGVGSMKLNTGSSEEVDLSLKGAGEISIAGKAKLLRASLGGVGGLEAKNLVADVVDVNMSGLGGASVYAKNSSKVNLGGMGSATVYGNPAQRNSTGNGLGRVQYN
ncbi:MAG TPA: DUF2807 domain-containing protein [Telluria sp.]|nr:DUF2807 domain-containing protein [Telluria sp.]